MNFPNFYPSAILLAVFALSILQQGAIGQKIITQKYLVPPNERGCKDLQLNGSAQFLIADDKIYLFTDLSDFTNQSEFESDLEILMGEIDRKTAFSLDAYEVEWRISPNFTYRFPFLSGDGSHIVFSGEQRARYRVPNITESLIRFDPTTHGLETIEWPSAVPEEALPDGGAVITVPGLQTTYFMGRRSPSFTEEFPAEVFAYNYSDNSIVRKKSPNKFWTTGSFIQLGEKGILVMLGGTEGASYRPLPMDQIYVYAIASDKWYLQQTSGPAPSSRVWSCAVVATAEDNSSFQIHMYGGHRPEDQNFLPIVDNYYILSVPQFIWTRPSAIRNPHTMTFCNLLGSHRMLITAGFPESLLECVELFQILDLNTGKLINTFGDNNNYSVPSSVISSIGGGARGGANITKPISGFALDFEQELVTPVDTTISPSPTHTPHPPPVRPLGAIIGGTVGVAFAVLLLCGFLFWRKRREAPGSSEAATTDVANPPAYPGTANHDETDGGQDRIQSPVSPASPLHELPNSVHELPGKTEPVTPKLF